MVIDYLLGGVVTIGLLAYLSSHWSAPSGSEAPGDDLR